MGKCASGLIAGRSPESTANGFKETVASIPVPYVDLAGGAMKG